MLKNIAKFASGANYDLLKENQNLRVSVNKWQVAFTNLQNMIDLAMSEKINNEDIIEELRSTGNSLALLAANELSATQEALVICRLDRDYWIAEHQKERDLADSLYDLIFNEKTTEEKVESIRKVIASYEKRRK
jgi:hypothetical protein